MHTYLERCTAWRGRITRSNSGGLATAWQRLRRDGGRCLPRFIFLSFHSHMVRRVRAARPQRGIPALSWRGGAARCGAAWRSRSPPLLQPCCTAVPSQGHVTTSTGQHHRAGRRNRLRASGPQLPTRTLRPKRRQTPGSGISTSVWRTAAVGVCGLRPLRASVDSDLRLGSAGRQGRVAITPALTR